VAQTLDDIVFVCGALRSGTTLLSLMIGSHPQLISPGEMDFMFEAPLLANGEADLDAYRKKLALDRIFLATGAEIDPSLDHHSLVRSFAARYAEPGKTLVITIHRNFERIPDIFPGARFIHIVRDPRDVARSSITMGWAGNVYYGADHWISSERSFDRLCERVAPETIHPVRNEDLIAQPEVELRRICAFLGVAYHYDMLAYYATSTYDAPDASLIEQWRRRLSRKETALVEARVGDLLAARGYEPSGFEPARPGPCQRFLLRQGNRLKRNAFEIRRFGLSCYILRHISNMLPLQPLKRAAAHRYNSIEETYLK